MRDHAEPADAPLWAAGEMLFRVAGAGAEPDRMVKVRRPFALVGRAPDADLVVDDRAASARHAYLHLDHRGVYAVDLVTRTGTRINGADRPVGWLRPGDWLEVAGRRIELLRTRLDGAPLDPPPCDADLLADSDRPGLVGVTLEPHRGGESPWVLGSELVFLGWSASCGIQVKDQGVARTHCALVRSTAGAFLVDLGGRQTWVEDRVVRGATRLHDGDLITLGSTQFTVHVEPAAAGAAGRALVPDLIPRDDSHGLLARLDPAGGLPSLPPLPLGTDIVPAEAQTALLAWIFGAIRGGQGEVLRRQGEFQAAMTQVLQQIQKDNATLLNAHLQKIEGIDRELAALRSEIQRRNAPPPPPNVEPLKINRPDRPADAGPETRAPTTWLLDRVNQLEEENRSAWKDLLGRLSQSRKG